MLPLRRTVRPRVCVCSVRASRAWRSLTAPAPHRVLQRDVPHAPHAPLHAAPPLRATGPSPPCCSCCCSC